MGQGTMLLSEAAEVSERIVEELAREAFEGRLKLHPMPSCMGCGAPQGRPCQPTCVNAGTQIVWLGDWFHWSKGGRSGE